MERLGEQYFAFFSNFQLAWHQTEHTLRGLHCGREYHMYVVLNNALGASPASKVMETDFESFVKK